MSSSNPYTPSRVDASGPAPERDQRDDDQRRTEQIVAVLLGFVAVTQLVALVVDIPLRELSGMRALFVIWPHLAVLLPAGAFAIGWWRGWRVRAATIAFAALWGGFFIWGMIMVARIIAREAANAPAGEPAPAVPWLVPLVAARALAFLAAIILLAAGRPGRRRRVAGVLVAVVFGLLFVAERIYMIVG